MSSNLLYFDNKLADEVKFFIGTKRLQILFQFPPKITNDSRTGTWEEVEIPGDQPISIWKTSGARKMSLEWTYVIGVNNWPVEKVKRQINEMRSYYTKKDKLIDTFIVMLKIWAHGGKEEMSCRLGNIDITYGKTLYFPGEDFSMAHPVITHIKVAIQPWTKGNAKKESTEGTAANAAADKGLTLVGKINVPGLKSSVPLAWQ
jgi:hypothetical protein